MKKALTLIAMTIFVGCDPTGDHVVHWEDGDYRVYARATSGEIILGKHMGSSAFMGIAGPQIVAVGSDDRYVFAKQLNQDEESYVIFSKRGDPSSIDLTEAEFNTQKVSLNLPGFEWPPSSFARNEKITTVVFIALGFLALLILPMVRRLRRSNPIV